MARHFEFIGISGELAHQLSQVLADSIRTRIERGLDNDDQAAPPLAVRRRLRRGTKANYLGADRGYGALKRRKGLNPIRDWTFSGDTLRALVPLTAPDGSIRVGFSNPKAARIAAMNQAIWPQFGVSPMNRADLIDAINQIQTQLVRIAA